VPSALVLVVAAASTFFCLAVNAYTWRIGYALWPLVRAEDFGAFHAAYLRKLNSVITVPHVLMFFSCGALVWGRPAWLDRRMALAVCLLTWSVVGISAFVAGPVHDRFVRQRSIDERGFRRLMRVSAVRTVMMLIASGLLGLALVRALR
jgi:hypothetical protein